MDLMPPITKLLLASTYNSAASTSKSYGAAFGYYYDRFINQIKDYKLQWNLQLNSWLILLINLQKIEVKILIDWKVLISLAIYHIKLVTWRKANT